MRRRGLRLSAQQACGLPDDVDWDEVAGLVGLSDRNTAPARLAKRLDAR